MAVHSISREDMLNELSSDQNKGLTLDKVKEHRTIYGPNRLKEKNPYHSRYSILCRGMHRG